uniref:Bm8518 n=1 Tax=Brugia malayi TaxID=6279 RepID=A0A0I9N7T7_BRUMA|nr:Bm8518 [Brugia malayi]
MAGIKKYYEHSAKPSAQLNQSVKCPKLYGIVEFEIEVTELLENISIALHYLQKIDLLWKDITFQEDMHCLASSKESIHGLNSREISDKTWRNIHQSKEFDEIQNDSMIFHRRFAAGSCILQKKIRQNDKKQKSRKTDPVLFEKKINQHSGQIGSKLKQLAKLPSYDVSYNSEILHSSNEQNVKKKCNELKKKTKI